MNRFEMHGFVGTPVGGLIRLHVTIPLWDHQVLQSSHIKNTLITYAGTCVCTFSICHGCHGFKSCCTLRVTLNSLLQSEPSYPHTCSISSPYAAVFPPCCMALNPNWKKGSKQNLEAINTWKTKKRRRHKTTTHHKNVIKLIYIFLFFWNVILNIDVSKESCAVTHLKQRVIKLNNMGCFLSRTTYVKLITKLYSKLFTLFLSPFLFAYHSQFFIPRQRWFLAQVSLPIGPSSHCLFLFLVALSCFQATLPRPLTRLQNWCHVFIYWGKLSRQTNLTHPVNPHRAPTVCSNHRTQTHISHSTGGWSTRTSIILGAVVRGLGGQMGTKTEWQMKVGFRMIPGSVGPIVTVLVECFPGFTALQNTFSKDGALNTLKRWHRFYLKCWLAHIWIWNKKWTQANCSLSSAASMIGRKGNQGDSWGVW